MKSFLVKEQREWTHDPFPPTISLLQLPLTGVFPLWSFKCMFSLILKNSYGQRNCGTQRELLCSQEHCYSVRDQPIWHMLSLAFENGLSCWEEEESQHHSSDHSSTFMPDFPNMVLHRCQWAWPTVKDFYLQRFLYFWLCQHWKYIYHGGEEYTNHQ